MPVIPVTGSSSDVPVPQTRRHRMRWYVGWLTGGTLLGFGLASLIGLASPVGALFFFYPILACIVGFAVVLGGGGLVWLACAIARKWPRVFPTTVLFAAFAMGVAVVFCGLVVYRQTEENARCAAQIIQAAEHYRADTGAYPKELAELCPTYLRRVPRCQYGLLRGDFYYSATHLDGDNPPYLIYQNMLGYTSRTYTFNEGKWQSSAWD
jgi:hypothetical protein